MISRGHAAADGWDARRDQVRPFGNQQLAAAVKHTRESGTGCAVVALATRVTG